MKALLSVYDKTGIEEFARGLSDLGWELISSGGTSAALTAAGIDHVEVADLTGAPEMLGGRVKTLHPVIHGGILADRSKPDHLDALERLGIGLIDLVVCNLYPFTSDPSIELIDVGRPDHGPGRGQEPRPRRPWSSTRPTTARCWTSCAPHGAALARAPVAGWPGRPSPTRPATTPPSWRGWTSASRRPWPGARTSTPPASTPRSCCPSRST